MPSSFFQRALLPLVFLAALGVSLLQYGGVLGSFFIIDDFVWLQCAAEAQADLSRVFNLQISNFFRPTSHLYFAALYALFGRSELAFHLGNLLLHALCVTLLVALARRLAGTAVALLCGAAFLLAPLYADAAVWVSSITEPVAAAAALLALLCWLRFWERPRGGWADYLGGVVALALALGSKESAVSLFVVLVWLHLGLWLQGRAPRPRRALLLYLPPLALQLAYLAFQYQIQQQNYLVANRTFTFGLHGLWAVAFSLGRLLYHTAPLYLAAGLGAILGWHRPALRPTLVAGGLLLLALVTLMAPTSMFGGAGLSSRYLYLPTMAAALGAALLAAPLWHGAERRGAALLGVALLALALNSAGLSREAVSRYRGVAVRVERFVDQLGALPRIDTPVLLLDAVLCGQQLEGALALYHPELARRPIRCSERKALPPRWRPGSVLRWDPLAGRFRPLPRQQRR